MSALPRTLRFSRSLYRPEAVESAAEAFAAVLSFELVREGESVQVVIDAVHPRLAAKTDTIIHELCNRALHETVLAERGGGGL